MEAKKDILGMCKSVEKTLVSDKDKKIWDMYKYLKKYMYQKLNDQELLYLNDQELLYLIELGCGDSKRLEYSNGTLIASAIENLLRLVGVHMDNIYEIDHDMVVEAVRLENYLTSC